MCRYDPILFLNRLDITRNILMLTDLQHQLMAHFWLRLLFDCLFLLLPVLLCNSVVSGNKLTRPLSLITSLFSLVYCVFISTFTYISLDMYVTWFFIPLVFYPVTNKGFYFVFHCLRLIFILFFFSAGLWKLRIGGMFNTEQMSGILLVQHKEYLVSNAGDWFSNFIYFLVQHKAISYAIYLLGAMAELIFSIGFFTRKYDILLLLIFLLFFTIDYFIMRINYISWLVFAGLFYFSKFKLEKDGV
jgi:hypothetical protein